MSKYLLSDFDKTAY